MVDAPRSRRSRSSLIGGHLDSVPNGGWLDGALNVVAGSEVLRRIAEEGEPPVTVRLVSWADEEGARFGRSLFGSSAAAGSMADQDELRAARPTATGSRCRTRSARTASTSIARRRRAAQLANAAAYLELHIEQGPVLESMDLPLGRRPRDLRGRAPPRDVARPGGACRLDADGSAPRRARRRREARAGAPRHRGARRATARSAPRAGSSARPGIVTSVVETAEQLLDQRHLDADKLAALLDDAKECCAAVRRGGADRRRVRADLEHRADPLRRRADRVRGRGDPGGRRPVAPAPERAAPRRGRGLARRRSRR